MEVPEGGPKMKKKRLFWVGSALAVGFLGLSTLSDWGPGTSPRDPEFGTEPSLNHSSSEESPPAARIDPSRPFRSLSRRERSRRIPSSQSRTANRQKPRRPRGIPLNKVLNRADLKDPLSVTPASAARRDGVARLSQSATGANLSSPSPEPPSPTGIGGQGPNPELEELEQGYQAAQARLFGGGGGAFSSGTAGTDESDGSDNPFDDALEDPDSGDPGSDGEAGDDGDSDSSSGDPGDDGGEGDSGDGDTGSGGGTGDTGGDTGGPIAPPIYDFLLIGPVGSSDGEPLHRAWRASSTVFVLEDSTESIFQPGFTPFNVFEDQQLYFGDSDGDGDLDVTIVSLIPTLGSTVETFHQTGNGFVLFSALLTYQKSVRCLEYFDFSGGDGNELALTFEGEPNLHIYESIEGSWVYQSEMALSFTPGVLIKSLQGAGVGSSLLYIISDDFESVANLLSIRPDVVRANPDIPLTKRQFFNVSWREEISTEDENVMAIEMVDKIILIDWDPNRWKWNMTLSGPEFQRTIIGYYSDNQLRQTVWIP